MRVAHNEVDNLAELYGPSLHGTQRCAGPVELSCKCDMLGWFAIQVRDSPVRHRIVGRTQCYLRNQ
jgi:hypothetical protein